MELQKLSNFMQLAPEEKLVKRVRRRKDRIRRDILNQSMQGDFSIMLILQNNYLKEGCV